MDSNFGIGPGDYKKGNGLEEYTSSEEDEDIEEGQKLDMLQDRRVLGEEDEEDEPHGRAGEHTEPQGVKENWDDQDSDEDY